jgi:hypothetical protein
MGQAGFAHLYSPTMLGEAESIVVAVPRPGV